MCVAYTLSVARTILYAYNKKYSTAKDIEEKYKDFFDSALKNGVKILCYDCKISNEEIIVNNQIKYEK